MHYWVHDLLVESRTWAESLIVFERGTKRQTVMDRYSNKGEDSNKVPKAMTELWNGK